MDAPQYDPFASGRFPAGVRTIQASDLVRGRVFPVEMWYPAQPGKAHPLVLFSHSSGGHRRAATFRATHLASHGYAVAAMDHSEVVAAELARTEGETDTARAPRIGAVIASRGPDIRFLIDHLLGEAGADIPLDVAQIGLVGHSFGGWTVLTTAEVEPRVRAVVAMVPGGSSRRRPGILPLPLRCAWDGDVPTMYLAAEQDTMIPLASVYELFDRTPASKRLFILRRADHQHFIDDVEGEHEALRSMSLPGDAAWIPAAMRPISELASGEQAHVFVRGLTLAHFDATLRQLDAAQRFLAGDIEAELARRGVEAIAHRP